MLVTGLVEREVELVVHVLRCLTPICAGIQARGRFDLGVARMGMMSLLVIEMPLLIDRRDSWLRSANGKCT